VHVTQRVGLPLFNALIDYDSDQFDRVVNELLPVKYDISDGLLNGSRAQVPLSLVSVTFVSPTFVSYVC